MVIVSPDVGNVKVANMYAGLLDAKLAIIDKRRESGSEVVSKRLIGEVEGKVVLMVDDMISTAGTICEAAKLVVPNMAQLKLLPQQRMAFASDPQLNALMTLQLVKLSSLTRFTPTSRLDDLGDKLHVLSVGRYLGEAIHRIHHHMSISALFTRGEGPKK